MGLMKGFLKTLVVFAVVGAGRDTLNAQGLLPVGCEQDVCEQLARIDTGVLKLRARMYPSVFPGDLNTYGFEDNDVPVFSDSAYAYRLSTLETEIPLQYNDQVRAYIDLYTIRKRELVGRILAWSKYYFPLFEEIFDREQIPIEMKYLAVIESALNQNAVSRVGATGLWQFMAPTGRIYGLRTNSSLDERREMIRST